MKNIKKIFTVVLTFVMSVFMINTVSASTGKITINNTTVGKTYELYRIFDLTHNGNKVSYTIASAWETFFTTGEGAAYIIDTNEGNTLNPITVNTSSGKATKYINITGENVAEFTQKALAYAATLSTNDGEKVATGTTEEITGLALGYYLIYPRGATNIKPGNGSIASIDSTIPEATVNIKAEYPTITKTVDDQNTDVGQLVTFTITGQVPDTTGYNSYTYQISDTMTTGLQFNSEVAEFTVKFIEEKENPEENVITPISVTPVYGENGFTLTFDMVNYQQYVGQKIEITYKARVTEDAVNSSTTKNSATLTYSNNPKTNETSTTNKIEIPVYSSEIVVTKIEEGNEEVKLPGAKFVLTKLNEFGETVYYRAIDESGNIIADTTTTQSLVNVEWVQTEEEATKLITDSTGIITFKGIENGTYNLIELEAPAGYNKLTDPVTVKIGYTDQTGTNLGTVAISYQQTVENKTGQELPSTGGFGTKMFIIIGSLLALVSAIILVTNKIMSKEYL